MTKMSGGEVQASPVDQLFTQYLLSLESNIMLMRCVFVISFCFLSFMSVNADVEEYDFVREMYRHDISLKTGFRISSQCRNHIPLTLQFGIFQDKEGEVRDRYVKDVVKVFSGKTDLITLFSMRWSVTSIPGAVQGGHGKAYVVFLYTDGSHTKVDLGDFSPEEDFVELGAISEPLFDAGVLTIIGPECKPVLKLEDDG